MSQAPVNPPATPSRRRRPPFLAIITLIFLGYIGLSAGLTVLAGLPWVAPLPQAACLAAGIPLLACGAAMYVWSVKSLGRRRSMGGDLFKSAAESRLVTRGAMARCRNPIYFALTLFIVGLALVTQWVPMAFMVVLAFVHFMVVARWEERELAARFGQEYLDYKSRTPFFIPRLRRPR
jgi:protein-S-isoprenylcysteine O-methyltransferase Ste14